MKQNLNTKVSQQLASIPPLQISEVHLLCNNLNDEIKQHGNSRIHKQHGSFGKDQVSPAPYLPADIFNIKENKFTGCTIVATGKLEHFTRDGINDKILELGAKPGSSVTKKTDYLICGEKAGSKLAKAQSLGIPILTEAEFLEMIA